jgi:hypothetical protein
MEERANPTVYDDYRFVTRADLVRRGWGCVDEFKLPGGGPAGRCCLLAAGGCMAVVAVDMQPGCQASSVAGKLAAESRGRAAPPLSHHLLVSALVPSVVVLQEKLGLTHLVGTPLLRAYMHGFFIDNRLYGKAKAIVDPFAYEAYRAKRVAAKVDEERRSRISLVKKLPKVRSGAVLVGISGGGGGGYVWARACCA